MHIHVTNILGIVTVDVTRDICTLIAAKNVPPVSLGWLVEKVAVAIV